METDSTIPAQKGELSMSDLFTREEAEAKVGKKVRHLIDAPYPFDMFKKDDVWDVTDVVAYEEHHIFRGYIVHIAPKVYQHCKFTPEQIQADPEFANEHVAGYCYNKKLYTETLAEVD
jgi:hypothetical protein